MNSNRVAVWVNESCSYGSGKRRWEKIAKASDIRLASMIAYTTSDGAVPESCDLWVREHLEGGTKKFVAVGGDGTVHQLANSLVKEGNQVGIAANEITLGAIGTGSSNDFHKPFGMPKEKRIAGYPCRLDFAQTVESDLMRVTDNSKMKEQYSLINASLGITANANHFFNHPDKVLGVFKSLSSNLAIVYAALKTLVFYKSQQISLAVDESALGNIRLTNLGIIKNRHFSGAFRYERGAGCDSGDFYLYLCHDMKRVECLKALLFLAMGRFAGQQKTLSVRAKSLRVTSLKPFAVEMDGEVSLMQDIHVSIEPRRIRLCL